jgi:hypothetical protein
MRSTHLLVLGLAACGTVKGNQLADAPSADDASVITRGAVTVTVLDPSGNAAPAVGANVVFLDPDGTLVKTASTDARGKATADVLPGGSVTSIVPTAQQTVLTTVLAIKPGDDLTIGTVALDTTAATFTVTFPQLNGAAGAASYEVSGPCGQSAGTVVAGTPTVSATLTVYPYCKQATMDLVVSANDSAGAPIGVLEKANVAYVAGGVTAISGAYQPPHAFAASYTAIDPAITRITSTRSVPDQFGVSTSKTVLTPGTATTISEPGTTAATARVGTVVQNSAAANQVVFQNILGTATTYGLNVGASLLAWLGTPTFDAASHKFVVPVDTTGITASDATKPDAFRLTVGYRRTDPATGAAQVFAWNLYAPAPGDIPVPKLPPDFANLVPVATDVVALTALMFEADALGGYDAVRSDLLGAFVQYLGTVRVPSALTRISRSPLVRGLR